jgi:hypothetical protein
VTQIWNVEISTEITLVSVHLVSGLSVVTVQVCIMVTIVRCVSTVNFCLVDVETTMTFLFSCFNIGTGLCPKVYEFCRACLMFLTCLN